MAHSPEWLPTNTVDWISLSAQVLLGLVLLGLLVMGILQGILYVRANHLF